MIGLVGSRRFLASAKAQEMNPEVGWTGKSCSKMSKYNSLGPITTQHPISQTIAFIHQDPPHGKSCAHRHHRGYLGRPWLCAWLRDQHVQTTPYVRILTSTPLVVLMYEPQRESKLVIDSPGGVSVPSAQLLLRGGLVATR